MTAELNSLSKASELLNISQPALSKQIRKLEDVYGVTLFYRSPLGVELTKAGSLLLERIRPVVLELDSIRVDLQVFSDGLQQVTIGTIPSLAAYYLPEKGMKLRAQGMEVKVEVRNTSSEVLELLNTRQVDAALMEKEAAPGFLWSVDLFSERYMAVLPATHRLGQVKSVTISDLEQEPLIVYPTRCDVRKAIVQEYRKHGFEPRISTEIPFGELILNFVAAGAGIAIVPKITSDHPGGLPLSVAPIVDMEISRTISLVCNTQSIGLALKPAFTSQN